MDLQIVNKVVRISAPTPGISSTFARVLAAGGARVVFAAYVDKGLTEAVKGIRRSASYALGIARTWVATTVASCCWTAW